MYIRAPKTGLATLHVGKSNLTGIVKGVLIFSFEDDEERLELMKVETSLFLLSQLLSRAKKVAGTNGTAREFERVRLANTAKTSGAFGTLLELRRDERETGKVNAETLDQAALLECLSRKEQQETALECSNVVSSADSLLQLTELQIAYNQTLRQKISDDIAHLQIVAPISGSMTLRQNRTGWVSRGDILASIE